MSASGTELGRSGGVPSEVHRRRVFDGYTLVELLVVLAIIGILVGLLMPAVQAVRESARLTQCQNRIRQVALACHNYEAAFKELPGYAGETRAFFVTYKLDRKQNPDMTGGSWIAQAMFYMEQDALANRLVDIAERVDMTPTPKIEQVVRSPVATLICPTRRDAKAYPLLEPYLSRYGQLGARTDFAMNGGPAHVDEEEPANIEVQKDGAWILGKRTKFSRVIDGLSYTYLLGEKAMDPMKYTSGHGFGDRAPLAGWRDSPISAPSYVRYAARPPKMDSINSCIVCHDFGSAHPAGWNAAMADGSVRTMSFYQDLEVHRENASVAGREIREYKH